jgi:hypothetical protein
MHGAPTLGQLRKSYLHYFPPVKKSPELRKF